MKEQITELLNSVHKELLELSKLINQYIENKNKQLALEELSSLAVEIYSNKTNIERRKISNISTLISNLSGTEIKSK